MARRNELARDTCRAVLFSVRKTPKRLRKETGRNQDISLYLVQQETDGYQGFSFPGGGMEEGETHLECVYRAAYEEGIDIPIETRPIAEPVIFSPDMKARFGFESDHSTYYYLFVKEAYEIHPVAHPEGDVHYIAAFDLASLPLGEDPSEHPVLSVKQQLALHYILMDYDIKCALNYRRIGDVEIDNLLHELAVLFFPFGRRLNQ